MIRGHTHAHAHKPVPLEFHCPPISSSSAALSIGRWSPLSLFLRLALFFSPSPLTGHGNNAISCQTKRHNCTLVRRRTAPLSAGAAANRNSDAKKHLCGCLRGDGKTAGVVESAAARRPVIRGSQRKWLTQYFPDCVTQYCVQTMYGSNL